MVTFEFTPENFQNPDLPAGLRVIDVPVVTATADALKGYGYLVEGPDHFTCAKGNFEICKWPTKGWRSLDPGTGDEAGTVEGEFAVNWKGDFYYGKNLAVSTTNNQYLDGLGAVPENASHDSEVEPDSIYLWMSDYHPDGAQMFWSNEGVPFTVCLGLSSYGDNIAPWHMRAFHVPAGKGVYIHPGTWHNGIYIEKKHSPATFLTRQGRVHARVSCNWAHEFQSILRVRFDQKEQ